MTSRNQEPQAAFVEDYDSDGNETLPETRQYANSKPKSYHANQVNGAGDGHSDSGYSSHTAATVNSADSTGATYYNQEKRFTLPHRQSTSQPSKPRPTLAPHVDTSAQDSGQRSPRKNIPRTPSTKSPRKSHMENPKYCDCQDCELTKRATPLETSWNVNYPQFSTARPRPSGPPSPQATRAFQQNMYAQEAPMMGATPRPRAESMRRARPTSFHPGMAYDMSGYGASPFAPAPEMRPPPSRPTFANSSANYPLPSYPPLGAGFMMPQPRSLEYNSQYNYDVPTSRSRPSQPQWQPDSYANRPQSSYGAPVPDYGFPESKPVSVPIARRHSQREAPMERQYSQRSSRDEDAHKMPPPAKPPARPRIHHAATTSAAREIPRQAAYQTRDSEARMVPERSRSQTRPSSSRKADSYSAGDQRLSTEERRRRRSSAYYGVDSAREVERERTKQAEVYQEEVGAAAPLTADALRAARRNTRVPSESGSHSKSSSEGKSRSDANNFTIRLGQNANVNLDIKGDPEGRTISVRPGEDGEYELSFGSKSSKYSDSVNGTSTQYSRNTGSKRDSDERRSSREQRSSNRSRKSSRAAYDRY